MNPRDVITATVALCLALAAAGAVGGAVSCQTQRRDCLEAWKASGVGALAAATTGGTLLAQLDGRRRDPEEPKP